MSDDKKENPMKDYEFHNIDQVCERCEMSRQTVYDLMDAGKFPRYFITNDEQVLWFQKDINQYLVINLAENCSLDSISFDSH